MNSYYVQNHSYIQEGGVRFDILKFVLAMLIVVLHSGIAPRWTHPVLRLAVPLFFMMTSYFFHLKLKGAVDNNSRKECLRKYVTRNAHLYLFWSIALLPCVVLLHSSWFNDGFVNALINIVKSFFITGFFPASWFVLSSVYAVVIIFVLSKWLKNGWIFFIAFLIYLVALLDSNYGGLLSEQARNQLNILGIRHALNLPAAMIWMVIGKVFAEKPFILSNKPLYSMLVVSGLLYFVEFFIIEHFGWSIHTDCFLMSIPLCILIFIAIGQSADFNCKYALWLRKSSVIVYCTHFTIIRLLRLVSLHVLWLPGLAIYGITLIICLFVAGLIIYLSENTHLKILRKAY